MHTRCKAVHSVDESLNNSASGKRFGCKMFIHLLLNMMTVLMAIECLIKLSCLQHSKLCFLQKKCGGDIKLSENCVRGLSSVFSIECKNCKDLCSFRNSKMLGKRKYSRNKQTFCIRNEDNGQGHAAMTTFLWCHGLSPPVAENL
ncbi:hypothetical protein TNCV_4484881 [Trichonephila clavipes]|nr:hypothetical protein TNCV_4484881 [Trichonephila clavipes]